MMAHYATSASLDHEPLAINSFRDPMPSKTPTHRSFSPARIAAIASNTLLELVRLKVFYFMLIFALLHHRQLGVHGAKFTFQEQFQVLKDVSLGAMSIFTWLLAMLATAMLLPKDIEDRTLYTILAKPVPRFEYLLGKLLGVLALLFVALALMSAVFVACSTRASRPPSRDTARVYAGPGELEAALEVKCAPQRSTPTCCRASSIIYLKAALCAALTLLLSTFATSWIFTIIVSVVVYHHRPRAADRPRVLAGAIPGGDRVAGTENLPRADRR